MHIRIRTHRAPRTIPALLFLLLSTHHSSAALSRAQSQQPAASPPENRTSSPQFIYPVPNGPRLAVTSSPPYQPTNPPPADDSNRSATELRIGMTAAEVLKLLGKPNRTA